MRLKTVKELLRQKNFMFKLGLFICLAWVLIALLAPLIAPHDPTLGDVALKYQPPSADYWFGTDELGRDVFSRLLYGSRVSITCGLITVLISFVIGVFFGGLAGYVGGIVDDIMMRFSEMIQSFPPLILAMVIATALGANISNSVLAMAIIWWPNYARLTRSIVISIKANDYVTASRVLGATHTRVLGKELLPNSIGSMVVMCTLDLGNAIPLWELPGIQKYIARRCRAAGVPFCLVTQLLWSMEERAVPTRAEVSDIYNAVLDGSCALMLTGETAAGRHPLEAMEYLARTARCALRDLNQGVSLFPPEGAETATKTLKLGDSVQWRT